MCGRLYCLRLITWAACCVVFLLPVVRWPQSFTLHIQTHSGPSNWLLLCRGPWYYRLDVFESVQMTNAYEPSQRKYPTIAVAFLVSAVAVQNSTQLLLSYPGCAGVTGALPRVKAMYMDGGSWPGVALAGSRLGSHPAMRKCTRHPAVYC